MKLSLKNFFLYGSVKKEGYNVVKNNIAEGNRMQLSALSLIVAISVCILLVLSFFIDNFASSRISFIVCVCVSVLMFIVAKFIKGKNILILICVYVFSMMQLGVGIVLGTIVEPTQASVSFVVMIFVVPLLFVDIPVRSNILIIVSIVGYVIAAKFTQSAEMFSFNLAAVLPYGVLSILISTLTMCLKIRAYALQRENRILSFTDQLTGMLNRRSYEMKIAELINDGGRKNLIICAFDVNGLKTANDTLGHQAGDELIIAASNCIKNTFGPYGDCYRTGGDEFMAILDKDNPGVEELLTKFHSSMDLFKGVYVKNLSIATGLIPSSDGADIHDLIAKADKAMYADKDEYYKRTGLERRKGK